jgi:hypothetical protein
VANSAPTIGTVSIAPSSPTTTSTLTATPGGFGDADSDALTYAYQWFKNGVLLGGETGKTLDLSQPGNGDKGDTIKVEVTASDGHGGAADPVSDQVTVLNSMPAAGAVAISPSSPTTTSTLTATPSGFSDPDGDALAYAYQWFRNGTPIAGATNSTLNLATAGNGDRGDTIKVEVTASDGHGGSAGPVSNTVTVTNAQPAAGAVAISPSSPTTTSTLTATPSGFSDPDGDDLAYAYQWFRNGTPIAGATNSTLNLATAGNGDRGDTIKVEVTASDGHGGSAGSVSNTVTVTNAQPTAGTVAIVPASPRTKDTLTANPSGFADADSDALTYAYQWFKNGVLLGGETGKTLDLSQPGNGDKGDTIKVEVTASDGHGGAAGPVSASVKVINSKPKLQMGGANAKAAYSDAIAPLTVSATDDDGDGLTFSVGTPGLPSGLALTNNGGGTATVAGRVLANAGTYAPVIVVSDGVETDSAPASVVVDREDARLEYTGGTIAPVNQSIQLRVTVWDSAAAGFGTGGEPAGSATLGDITKLWVGFHVQSSCGTPLANDPIRYAQVVDTGALGDGIGTATQTLTSNSEDSFCIIARLVTTSGNPTASTWYASLQETSTVAFYVNSGQFGTGGGWVLDPTGPKGHLSFNARYNKRGSPQGKQNYIWRGTYNGVGADFIIKSTALDALRFTPGTTYPLSATLEGKATLQINRASDGLMLWSEGNATFSATATDAGTSGTDAFALRVIDKNGVPFKSFEARPLQGGNLVVRNR